MAEERGPERSEAAAEETTWDEGDIQKGLKDLLKEELLDQTRRPAEIADLFEPADGDSALDRGAVTTLGKPPALPGDSQSLTFAGTKESLPPVNRSKFNRRKAQNERHWKATAFAMGMQVSHSVDSQVSAESSVWAITPRIR
jgi:hypothetical protein